jgi:hypothetical protein
LVKFGESTSPCIAGDLHRADQRCRRFEISDAAGSWSAMQPARGPRIAADLHRVPVRDAAGSWLAMQPAHGPRIAVDLHRVPVRDAAGSRSAHRR